MTRNLVHLVTMFCFSMLSVAPAIAIETPASSDVGLSSQPLLKVKSAGEMLGLAKRDLPKTWHDFLKTKLRGYESSPIELQRKVDGLYVLRSDKSFATFRFQSDNVSALAPQKLIFNDQEIVVDFSKSPEVTYNALAAALPKTSSATANSRFNMASRAFVSDAQAIEPITVTILVVGTAAAAGFMMNRAACMQVENMATRCSAPPKPAIDEAVNGEAPELKPGELKMGESLVGYGEALRASWLSGLTCGGKKDEIRKCLKRRGFNVEAIEKAGSTEEQMRTPADGAKGNAQ